MARAESSVRYKWAKQIPKSTYEARGVRSAPEFVERIRHVIEARAAEKPRAARIFGNRGARETYNGPEYMRIPRGRHRESLHGMRRGKGVSPVHDYDCRVCEPSSLVRVPGCRLCNPLTAYAQGGHAPQPGIGMFLPLTMEYLRVAQRNRPLRQGDYEDAWRRMKIARRNKAAELRECNVD